MTSDKMALAKMTSDKMSLGKMTSDKMPWCLSKMKRIEQNEQSATKALFFSKFTNLALGLLTKWKVIVKAN
jgi:hypothetical protein